MRFLKSVSCNSVKIGVSGIPKKRSYQNFVITNVFSILASWRFAVLYNCFRTITLPVHLPSDIFLAFNVAENTVNILFNRIFLLSSSFVQQNRRVLLAGLRMANLASSSSTFQRWSGALLDEIARSWEETLLQSPRPPKISLFSLLLATRQKLQN